MSKRSTRYRVSWQVYVPSVNGAPARLIYRSRFFRLNQEDQSWEFYQSKRLDPLARNVKYRRITT